MKKQKIILINVGIILTFLVFLISFRKDLTFYYDMWQFESGDDSTKIEVLNSYSLSERPDFIRVILNNLEVVSSKEAKKIIIQKLMEVGQPDYQERIERGIESLILKQFNDSKLPEGFRIEVDKTLSDFDVNLFFPETTRGNQLRKVFQVLGEIGLGEKIKLRTD